LQIYDVVNADEAWLTTTPYCIAPCTKINNIPVGDGKIGPLFYRFMEAWSARVKVDILEQIQCSKP
jgi:branched-chain amino acid aminotransferase